MIDPLVGVPDFWHACRIQALDDIKHVRQAAMIFQKLYSLFVNTDALLAEINPLVLTEEGNIVA